MKLRFSYPLPLAVVCGVLATNAAQFKFPTQTLTVPDGFEVELVAGTNLIQRPVSAGFDDQGRLYVTDSSGSNDKPDQQLKDPKSRVLRLEDADGDGRFDKSVVFADKVMFPQGCLWHDGWVYVAAPPSIWRFKETNADGISDVREEWFKGGTLTGCANDIHGPYLGPDGYIYWTKGAFAEQTHKLGNGRTLKDKAAHIFRARPDGSDLDVIMSGGMDNPVEVAFTAEGEAIFTSTFIDFSQPGFRDGIAHAVYGGVFGKVHDVIEDGRVKRTGPDVLHPFYQAGPSAECGLCRYESDVFGADYRDNFFATSFNLHKVTRHILKPNGATYASSGGDFLVSDSVDFHPTDVLEDADGSLLVVDTGGWYKLCCPSSQLAKPDVLGGIYRVRKKGAPKVEDPWGIKLFSKGTSLQALIKLLSDLRPTVRHRAMQELASGDRDTIAALSKIATSHPSASTRIAALWTLARIDHPAARRANFEALDDQNPGVAQVAAKSAALWRDGSGASRLFNHGLFGSGLGNVHLARTAIEALGRVGVRFDIPALFKATVMSPQLNDDPFFQHAITYALVHLGDGRSLRQMVEAGNLGEKRLALIALDQMDGSDLKPTEVTPFLSASDDRLRASANWILSRHPDWGGELAGWFRERLTAPGLVESERKALSNQLRILTRAAAGQQLLAEAVMQPGFHDETRAAALDAMAGAGLKEPPASWKEAVLSVLKANNSGSLPSAVRAARSMNGDTNIVAALRANGREAQRPAQLRLDALVALPAGASLDAVEFNFLRASLAAENAPITRSAAAGVLAHSKLDGEQLAALTDNLKSAGPLELNKLCEAFDGGGDEALGAKLLDALRESKSARAWHPSQLKPHFAKFPEPTQKRAEEFLSTLDADVTKQAANLEALLAEITSLPGDIRRGQLVFASPKTACATCHEIGYVGGHLGPSLTSVGKIRTDRDLLEALVYPSASFVRSYEPMIVVKKSGDEFSGVLRKDAADEVVLATGPETEARIARADIADVRPGTISVMPQGLDAQLSRQELADLITFLKSMK